MLKIKVIDMSETKSKPIIETLINTAAIALTGAGTAAIITGKYLGMIPLLVGMGLEFFKYWGRKAKYW